MKKYAALAGSITAAALMLSASVAFAATPNLFGGATMGSGTASLVSNTADVSTANDYSGIDFPIASSTTLASLGTLSATYNVLGTDCGGGSPRFQINVMSGSTTKNVFAYIGPQPNYTGCTQNTATTSGNLLSSARSVDTSQLPGGAQYDTYAHLLAAFGSTTVTGIQLVADAGWAFQNGMQNIDITQANVGGTSYSFGSTTGTSTALMAPANTSPANGATLTSAQWTSANWSMATGGTGPYTYQYESSNGSTTGSLGGAFTSPVFQSGSLSSTSINTSNTSAGTYWWHVRAMDSAGATSSWSMPTMVTVSNATSTTPLQDLINQLTGLLGQFPSFSSQIQGWINQLNGQGTTTPPVTPPTQGSGSIDNNYGNVSAGGNLDFIGRNFGHEENVTVALNGSTVRTVHADGGGNFSTGSMTAPSTAGTYTYTFTGQNSGTVVSAVVTIH
ncbi:MAG: hypothetical protein JWO43_75 [Candidatus Adlerbacteria bacterium]|nr:hypothetical protein [Candidatus Adlerbacteria bacterium]